MLQTRDLYQKNVKYRERQEIDTNMLMHLKKPIIKINWTIKHLRAPNFSYLSVDIVKVGLGANFGGFGTRHGSLLWNHCFFFNFDFVDDLLHNYIAFKAIFYFIGTFALIITD